MENNIPENGVTKSIGKLISIFKIVIFFVIIGYLTSGIQTIQTNEAAIILRFGKVVGTTRATQIHGSGLLFAFPKPIDEVIRVGIKEIKKVVINELSLNDVKIVNKKAYDSVQVDDATYSNDYPETIDPTKEGYLITGDQYVVQPKIIVRYQITDPINYVLNQVKPVERIKDSVIAEITKEIGKMNVDLILTNGKTLLSSIVMKNAQKRLDKTKTGITLIAVEFKQIIPPRQVIKSFQAVVSASIKKQTSIKEAESYRAEQIPQAEMEANQKIINAKKESLKRLAEAHSEIDKFNSLLGQYEKDPHLVKKRIYLEAMEDLFYFVGKHYVVPADGKKPQNYKIELVDEQ